MRNHRIAILSFFKSENYGAILQATALQHAIESLGYSPCYLDYERKMNMSLYKHVLNKAYSVIRLLLGYRKRQERTANFIKQNIIINRFSDEDAFDVYVVGSDQVWFPGYVDDFFLLAFVHHSKKVSYASSFGVRVLPPSIRDYFFSRLSSFDAISTREEDGAEIIRSLGLDSATVLDPTLLFTKEYWETKVENLKISGNYVLCYVMNGDPYTAKVVFEQARVISRSFLNNCKVLIIGDKEYKRFIPGYNLICDAGPAEFLGYIKNATFVVTSSFHGTCFSILYEKNYINILKNNNPLNSRIEDLSRKLGLDARVYYTDSINVALNPSPIDYGDVRLKLNILREKSLNFLNNSLQ